MLNARFYIYTGYFLLNLLAVRDGLALVVVLPVMALVLINVLRIRDRYVFVDDIVTFIIYLFFVIAPMQQIDHGRLNPDGPVGRLVYADRTILLAGAMVAIFYGLYTLLAPRLLRARVAPVSLRPGPNGALTLFLLAAIGFVGYAALLGPGNLFAARYDQVRADGADFKGIPLALQLVATTMLCTFVRPRLDWALLLFGVALLMLAVALNPFNSARFVLIAAYVPLGFVLLRGRIAAIPFYAAAMVMIVFVMPILNLTTRFGSIREAYARGAVNDSGSLLDLPFIDVFDMLVECVRYTGIHGFTWGAKLVGIVFFFVPRSIWAGKPTLTALDIGEPLFEQKIAGTANLSMFLIGDGYRDLGLAGAAIVSLLVVGILHLLLYRRPTLVNGMPILHYIFIASVPILIRGPISAVLSLFFLQGVWFAVLIRVYALRSGALRGESLRLPAKPRTAPA